MLFVHRELAVLFVSTLCVLAFASACPTPGDGDSGNEGEGEGDGDVAPRPTLAPGCASTTCAAGQVCLSLADTEDAAACFAACTVPGDPCTTLSNRAGTCVDVDAGPACVASSDNLDGCGNRANARCNEGLTCATASNIGVQTCVRPCDPAAPTSCLSGTPGCGCRDDEVCTRFVAFPSGDGICAPPTSAGTVCGAEANGDLHPCTSGRCLVQSSPYPGFCE
jgi:hypothetical protein